MFRIGPFSRLVRVSARMLRHYEKCGLLTPAQVEWESGYRLYSASQIPLVQRIVALRDMGFTTQEIGAVLEQGDDPIWLKNTLGQRMQAIEADIALQQERLSNARRALQQMKENPVMSSYTVQVKEVPAVNIISVRRVMPSYYAEGDLWHTLYRFVQQGGHSSHINGGSCYSIYHDSDFKEEDVDVEVGLPWDGSAVDGDGIGVRELEAIPLAACVVCEGPYEKIGEATAYLAKWIEENGYQIIGNSRGIGLKHPGNEQDKDHYKTEIQFPVCKG